MIIKVFRKSEKFNLLSYTYLGTYRTFPLTVFDESVISGRKCDLVPPCRNVKKYVAIDPFDFTFSKTVQPSDTNSAYKYSIQRAPFGTVSSCYKARSIPDLESNFDLYGTGLKFKQNQMLVPFGWSTAGTKKYSDFDSKVTLDIRGECSRSQIVGVPTFRYGQKIEGHGLEVLLDKNFENKRKLQFS